MKLRRVPSLFPRGTGATALVAAGLLLVLAGLALPGPPAVAQGPQQTYTLRWWTVDGGGISPPAGAGYTLGGTAGQPDPGVLSGGRYTLGGGFWGGGVPSPGPRYAIYLPVVIR